MNDISLGIDFGTTKTLVSWFNPSRQRPELIRLGRGKDNIPTTVYLDDDGTFLFGEDADDMIKQSADRYARAFKLALGSDEPCLFCRLGTRRVRYAARDLAREFLKYVKQRCENEVFMGKTVNSAVVTCPVSFSPARRADLEKAAHEAGFTDVQLITEPEAAGYAFCTLCPNEAFHGNALIVDWGGGTLDLALVSREGDRVRTHAQYTAGDESMGGEAFDVLLWEAAAQRILAAGGPDLRRESPELQNSLLSRLREDKEMLSRQEKRKLRLHTDAGPCPPVDLTRPEWERLIHSNVEKASSMAVNLMRGIQERSLSPEMLLLVGGTSLTPCIADTMTRDVGLPCRRWQYSREAVCLGAALLAAGEKNVQPDAGNAPKSDPAPNAQALYEQGVRARDKEGATQKAVQLFRQAAELGHAEAQYALGACCDNGQGTAQNYAEAVQWYRKAAEQGNADAQTALGECYYFGRGVAKDFDEGLRWWQKAAEQKKSGEEGSAKPSTGAAVSQAKPVPPAPPAPPRAPAQDYLNMSFDFQCGLNGKPIDYAKAAECARKGHEQGDLNCTYQLAECYEMGIGVPKDHGKMLELAQEMVNKGFAPGYEFLAKACGGGYRVPLDPRKRSDYANRMERELMKPVPGIQEDIRYAALLTSLLESSTIDYPKLEVVARENLAISRLPNRYFYLAGALLGQVKSTPSVKEEVRQLLDEGCRQNDLWSFSLKAMALQNEELGIYPVDPQQALQLLRRGTATPLAPVFLMELALATDDQQERANTLEKYWDACNYGCSYIHRSDALPCSIRVQTNSFSCAWKVYEHSVAQQYFSEEGIGNLISRFSPFIVLKNEGGVPLQNLRVRFCSKDKGLDRTISLSDVISPGGDLGINPEDHQLDLEEDLYVEVWSGDRYASMELNNNSGFDMFRAVNPVPPILMWWEKGFFGGYVLKLGCVSGTLTQVEVRKANNMEAVAKIGTLQENLGPSSAGWTEFSDSAGLAENEIFVVTSNEFAPVVGQICTTDGDQGSAGWVTAAKVAGAGLAGILLGS